MTTTTSSSSSSSKAGTTKLDFRNNVSTNNFFVPCLVSGFVFTCAWYFLPATFRKANKLQAERIATGGNNVHTVRPRDYGRLGYDVPVAQPTTYRLKGHQADAGVSPRAFLLELERPPLEPPCGLWLRSVDLLGALGPPGARCVLP